MLLMPFLGVAVLYAVVASVIRRSGGAVGLVGACLLTTAAFSYGMYRYVCSQPMTCDVGGPGAAWYYFSHVTPVFALVGGLGFGVGSVVIHHRAEGRTEFVPNLKELAIRSASVFGSLVVGGLLLESLK
jgi:hypothetical protein